MSLNFGCDPELFLAYRDRQDYDKFLNHGMFVMPPAAIERFSGLVPLSTDNPRHPLYISDPFEDNELRFVGDGAAMEVNFKKPFKSAAQFYNAIQRSKERLNEMADRYKLEVFDKPVINFDYHRFWTKELMKDPRFENSVIFGCDPDEDVWNTTLKCEIMDASTHPYRYGGGHIHISGDDAIEENPEPLVYLLAITTGNYCIAHSTDLELEKLRAMYYGKPGKHRHQDYGDMKGLEYRTPSNTWLGWSLSVLEGMFEQIYKALDLLKNPAKGMEVIDGLQADTVTAITTANRDLALEILSKL